MNIGKSIGTAISQSDMKATEVADKMGISRGALSAIINGHKQPTVMKLLAISNILGIKLSEMMALG